MTRPLYPPLTPTFRDLALALASYSPPQAAAMEVLTADVTYTSNNTPTTLAALQHTVSLPNTLYLVRGELFYEASINVDMQVGMLVTPTAPQYSWYMLAGLGPAETSVDAASQHQARAMNNGYLKVGTAGNGAVLSAKVTGMLMSPTTGLPVYVFPNIAQGVSSAATLTVHKGSWMSLTPYPTLSA